MTMRHAPKVRSTVAAFFIVTARSPYHCFDHLSTDLTPSGAGD